MRTTAYKLCVITFEEWNKSLFSLDGHNDDMDHGSGMEDEGTQEYDETLLLKS